MTRVLVTGGTGRVGSRVVPRLTGHHVRVLSHTRQGVLDGVEHVRADLVRDEGVAGAQPPIRWPA